MRNTPEAAAAPLPETTSLDRIARARLNLDAVLRGELAIRDLSRPDLEDVIAYDRIQRGGAIDNRSFAQRCIDKEVKRLNSRPSKLAWQVIELKCREIGS